jgi:uncharacterized membrane protein
MKFDEKISLPQVPLKLKIMILGILIMLCSIWGGAYLAHLCENTWAKFPSFATPILTFLGGVVVFFYPIIEME